MGPGSKPRCMSPCQLLRGGRRGARKPRVSRSAAGTSFPSQVPSFLCGLSCSFGRSVSFFKVLSEKADTVRLGSQKE